MATPTTDGDIKTVLDGAVNVNPSRVTVSAKKKGKILKAVGFYLQSDPGDPTVLYINEETGVVDTAEVTPDHVAEAFSRFLTEKYGEAIRWEKKRADDAAEAADADTLDS